MSEVWTPPTEWSSGDVDSGRFNDYVVHNPRFLHAASQRVYQASLSGTGITTAEVVGTLVIPAQPVNCWVLANASFNVFGSNVGDRWHCRIRLGSASGAVIGTARSQIIGGTTASWALPATVIATAQLLVAETPMTIVAQMDPSVASGSCGLGDLTGTNFLQACVIGVVQ